VAFETLQLVQVDPHIQKLVLNRPQAMNALNTQMGRELIEVQRGLRADTETRCLIVTGEGGRAFSAGGDLRERDGMSSADWRAQHLVFEEAVWGLRDLPMVTIAAVNGAAVGGGLEIALMCDFMHAASHAKFGFAEVRLGIMPGCGGTQHLPRALGERRAKELLYTGATFSAAEAASWGLVNRVHDATELQAGVLAVAEAIAANGPLALRRIKQSVQTGLQMDLHSALRVELAHYNQLVDSSDRFEGVRAFNERRAPAFEGR
jgi:enoyl-CoA hydratase